MRKNIFIALFFAVLIFIPDLAFAQLQGGNSPGLSGGSSPGLSGSNTFFSLQNPLNFDNICGFFKAIFDVLMIIGIPVAVFFIVYAGFLFVWARGRPDMLTKAKANAMYVAVGIAIFLGAWFLAKIIQATIQALGGTAIMSC